MLNQQTSAIIFRRSHKKCSLLTLVGTIDIKPVKVARNLGAWFDSHFSMSTHISMSCSSAFFWLHNIKRISQFLPRDKLEMVLHTKTNARYLLRSNEGVLLKHPSGKMKKSFGDRSFSVAAPTLWNALPVSLRSIKCISTFKSKLKTYLFKLAFNIS